MVSEINTLTQRIIIVDEERVLARDPRRRFDLRHERWKIADDRVAGSALGRYHAADADTLLKGLGPGTLSRTEKA